MPTSWQQHTLVQSSLLIPADDGPYDAVRLRDTPRRRDEGMLEGGETVLDIVQDVVFTYGLVGTTIHCSGLTNAPTSHRAKLHVTSKLR